jgi:hypothetical protein
VICGNFVLDFIPAAEGVEHDAGHIQARSIFQCFRAGVFERYFPIMADDVLISLVVGLVHRMALVRNNHTITSKYRF